MIHQVAENMCGGAAKLAEALAEGNAWLSQNERGQDRYWIDNEVASDISQVADSQKIQGHMQLSAEQWRHP